MDGWSQNRGESTERGISHRISAEMLRERRNGKAKHTLRPVRPQIPSMFLYPKGAAGPPVVGHGFSIVEGALVLRCKYPAADYRISRCTGK